MKYTGNYFVDKKKIDKLFSRNITGSLIIMIFVYVFISMLSDHVDITIPPYLYIASFFWFVGILTGMWCLIYITFIMWIREHRVMDGYKNTKDKK